MKSGLVALVLAFALMASALHAQTAPTAGDWLLLVPSALKAAAPFALIPEALSDPDVYWNVGAGLALWTVPNVALGINVARGDSDGARFWRKVNLGIDGFALAASLGIGAWLVLKDDSGWDDMVGAIYLAMSVPIGGAFALDFVRFPMER
ncbi:MAG TPA: hypothetical protein PKW82_00075 [Spirochaetales bacterium]|nr:hypothetical protein [Spirochaetales bacterium]